MKHIYLACCLGILTLSLTAQNEAAPTKWKIKKYTLFMGVDQDMVNNLDQSYLASTAKDGSLSALEGREFDTQDFYGGVCENPHFRAMVTFDAPGWRNVEVNAGMSLALNRVDGVYYRNIDNKYGYYGDYLSYDMMSNEVAIEVSMVKRLNVLNFLNFYGGVGTNLGYQFGGGMHVSGYTSESQAVDDNLERPLGEILAGDMEREYMYEYHETRNGFNNRLFAQIGMGILFFNRLELAVEYRRGIGYRAIFGSDVRMTNLQSTGLAIRYVLKS